MENQIMWLWKLIIEEKTYKSERFTNKNSEESLWAKRNSGEGILKRI